VNKVDGKMRKAKQPAQCVSLANTVRKLDKYPIPVWMIVLQVHTSHLAEVLVPYAPKVNGKTKMISPNASIVAKVLLLSKLVKPAITLAMIQVRNFQCVGKLKNAAGMIRKNLVVVQ
jgi:hypothetical protein